MKSSVPGNDVSGYSSITMLEAETPCIGELLIIPSLIANIAEKMENHIDK